MLDKERKYNDLAYGMYYVFVLHCLKFDLLWVVELDYVLFCCVFTHVCYLMIGVCFFALRFDNYIFRTVVVI